MKAGSRDSKVGSPANVRSVVLGTAGHIDHGKTALVLALTGTDTDRLPEEKSRGITIDLGFAALQLTAADGPVLDISIIDVPGHHAFIRNMLAGAGGIDCVMLVVAADEGVKAQTQEHLAICSLLGIRRGLVVLTKKDAVSPERLEQVRIQLAAFVERTFLQDAPMVAVSALTREGIAELKREMAAVITAIPERSTDHVTRLPVDRVFSMRGFGTVVTGTLQAGTISVEESLELHPRARAVRVRGVQVHGAARDEARAPNRVALNLSGVEVQEVERGDTVIRKGTLESVSTIDVELSMLPGAPALRHRSKVKVHAFTSSALATVLLYDRDAADGDAEMLARLKLSEPLVLAPGDRFVIRQLSPATTVGGGRVLDAHPLHRQRKIEALSWLRQVRAADAARELFLRVRRRGLAGTDVGRLVAETGLTKAAIRRLLEPLFAAGHIVGTATERMIASEFLDQGANLLVKELDRLKNVTVPGAQLRSKMRLQDWVFALIVARLSHDKRIDVRGDALSLPAQTSIACGQNPPLLAVDQLYAEAGLASPIVSEVTDKLGLQPKEVHELITTLLRTKRLVRMGADNLLVHADAIARLADDLRKHRGEQFDIARFKSFTGLTRKHAIPLLEYLDGARVTRNSGGTRVVL